MAAGIRARAEPLGLFNQWNQGKKSVLLNLTSPEARRSRGG